MAASPGSSSISMLWPDIVGYQHEKVHTGVLRTLLNYGNGPTDPVRVVVARGLTRDKSVVAVEWADQEQPLVWERPRRVLDLAGELRLSDGSAKPLAVETKVDSSWQAEWLQGSAPADAHGCLLAVGLTGLAASAESLAAVLDGLAGDAHWEQEARVSGRVASYALAALCVGRAGPGGPRRRRVRAVHGRGRATLAVREGLRQCGR